MDPTGPAWWVWTKIEDGDPVPWLPFPRVRNMFPKRKTKGGLWRQNAPQRTSRDRKRDPDFARSRLPSHRKMGVWVSENARTVARKTHARVPARDLLRLRVLPRKDSAPAAHSRPSLRRRPRASFGDSGRYVRRNPHPHLRPRPQKG